MASAPSIKPNELGAHGGKACPRRLPVASDPDGYGLGTEKAAEAVPSLLVPQLAWICRYDPVDAGNRPGGGTTTAWVRRGKAVPVPPARLPSLASAVTDLRPPKGQRVCTADLGPRWLFSYSHGGDLTGVVIDDYGCGDVRLTDDPFETAPGDAQPNGTVPGVLSGPGKLLRLVKAAGGK